MRALGFAWRSLVRQPARAGLAILGVAAVGALLFDMLLLSQGLVVSMQDLLDRSGWDVRVTSTGDLPGQAPRIGDAAAAVAAIGALPQVASALAIRSVDIQVDDPAGGTLRGSFEGVSSGASAPWTVLRGADVTARGQVVVNERLAAAAGLAVGDEVLLRANCVAGRDALPPARLQVVGVASFPFEATNEHMAGGSLETLGAACGGGRVDEVDMILVRSTGDAAAAADAIIAARPDVRASTNAELVSRLQQNGFTYFRQISAVLTTVTLVFAVLLITVLLTVSVNQRVGEIAALRALGLSRRRLVADVLFDSVLIVGIGGLLSLPLGIVLAHVLDDILKRMPGIPAALHFFVFDGGALVTHALLLGATAVAAALYPMRLVSRLPISATLRDQVDG